MDRNFGNKKCFKETNNSTKPFGEGIYKAIDCTLKLDKKLGPKSGNVDGYAGYLEINEGRKMVVVWGFGATWM